MKLVITEVINNQAKTRLGTDVPLAVGSYATSQPCRIVVPFVGEVWEDLMCAIMDKAYDMTKYEPEFSDLASGIQGIYPEMVESAKINLRMQMQLHSAQVLADVVLTSGQKLAMKFVAALSDSEFNEFREHFFSQDAGEAEMRQHAFDLHKQWAYSEPIFTF